MSTTRISARDRADEVGAALAAARAGDDAAFTGLVERHRREIQLHCYRMLGSLDESEDLVQEAFLRAWRQRESFQGRSTFRAWLYRIATNACLDTIRRRDRRPAGSESSEVPWLQPWPDRLLDELSAPDAEPDELVVSKETIELAFLVAIQHLPPRQRAVLILRGVLDWSAKDTAALLETSVPSVNSALQRARATLREHLPEHRAEWAPEPDPTAQERMLLRRYVEAHENGDPDVFIEMMRDDARFTMPPQPGAWTGAAPIVEMWKEGGFGSPEFGEMRCLITRANRQPAVACYVRRPDDREFRPMALDVLRIEEGLIAQIVTFPSAVFPAFGLPPKLDSKLD